MNVLKSKNLFFEEEKTLLLIFYDKNLFENFNSKAINSTKRTFKSIMCSKCNFNIIVW